MRDYLTAPTPTPTPTMTPTPRASFDSWLYQRRDQHSIFADLAHTLLSWPPFEYEPDLRDYWRRLVWIGAHKSERAALLSAWCFFEAAQRETALLRDRAAELHRRLDAQTAGFHRSPETRAADLASAAQRPRGGCRCRS